MCRGTNISRCTVALGWIVLGLAGTAGSVTIHVPSEQPTIQAGIDAAVDGDTVLVAPGTYTGDGNWNLDYHGKGIVVMGGGATGTARIYITYDYPAPYRRGFFFHSGEDSTAVLAGLMISGKVRGWGGAIRCDSGSAPLIENCLFIADSGIACGSAIGAFNGAHPLVRDCMFRDCTVQSYADPLQTAGTVACVDASVTLQDCRFEDNWAMYGGAVAVYGGTVIAKRCEFVRNRAQEYYWGRAYGGDGGSIGMNNSYAEFDNCLFLDNIAPVGADDVGNLMGGTGGVSAMRNSNCHFRNCTFVGNTTSPFTGVKAGAFYAESSAVSMGNCIVAFNNSYSTTFVDGNGASEFILENTDVYGNVGGDWVGAVTGQLAIRGNLSSDPQFCDTSLKRFTIRYDSPCVRRIDTSIKVIGALPPGCCSCQRVGNVDCDNQNLVDISDLTALIDKLFLSPGLPCCDTESDMDGEPPIDISDLTYLIDHLYISLRPLRMCNSNSKVAGR